KKVGSEGCDDEKIDGDNLADVLLKKGAPRRRWPRGGTPHVLGNGELGDLISRGSGVRLGSGAGPRSGSLGPCGGLACGGQDRAGGDPLSGAGASSASRAGSPCGARRGLSQAGR